MPPRTPRRLRAPTETAMAIATTANPVAPRPAYASSTSRGSMPKSGTMNSITGNPAARHAAHRSRPAASTPRTIPALERPLASSPSKVFRWRSPTKIRATSSGTIIRVSRPCSATAQPNAACANADIPAIEVRSRPATCQATTTTTMTSSTSAALPARSPIVPRRAETISSRRRIGPKSIASPGRDDRTIVVRLAIRSRDA